MTRLQEHDTDRDVIVKQVVKHVLSGRLTYREAACYEIGLHEATCYEVGIPPSVELGDLAGIEQLARDRFLTYGGRL